MFVNEVLFRYMQGFSVSGLNLSDTPASKGVITAGLMNLLPLGFIPAKDLYEAFCRLSEEDAVKKIEELLSIVRSGIGADVLYRPMYPNFPSQVAEAPEIELFENAVLHYISGGTICPLYEKMDRSELNGQSLRVLFLWEEKDYHGVFEDLLKANTPFPSTFCDDLRRYLMDESSPRIPQDIPVKENLAIVWNLLYQLGKFDILMGQIKTPTDLLRFIQSISDGDVSLNKPVYPCHMDRKTRRFILQVLDAMKYPQEEMFKNRTLWVYVGERVHPGEHALAKRYPNAFCYFEAIRKNEKGQSYEGKLEKAFATLNHEAVISLLKARPGIFARNLDRVLRVFSERGQRRATLAAFHEVASNISSRVLLQLVQYFMNRNDQESRIFKPASGSVFVSVERLEPLPDNLIEDVRQICLGALSGIYAKQPYMGAVYVDPALKNIAVPISDKNADYGFNTLPTGSRVALDPDANILRFFLYWVNAKVDGKEQRTDLDLSVVLLDKNFVEQDSVFYRELRCVKGNDVVAVHSGDYVDAPDPVGASEFVDVNIQLAKKHGIRYVQMVINGYTLIPFNEIETCHAGWMCRMDGESGEVYEPSTVATKFHITGERTAVPCIIDLEAREVVWMNSKLGVSQSCISNNVVSGRAALERSAKAFFLMKRISMYDLLVLHASARGRLVETEDIADVKFFMENMPISRALSMI